MTKRINYFCHRQSVKPFFKHYFIWLQCWIFTDELERPYCSLKCFLFPSLPFVTGMWNASFLQPNWCNYFVRWGDVHRTLSLLSITRLQQHIAFSRTLWSSHNGKTSIKLVTQEKLWGWPVTKIVLYILLSLLLLLSAPTITQSLTEAIWEFY
jgi:hypothetical protein